MSGTLSITQSQLFAALADFLEDLLGAGVEIVRGLDNRVPMPNAPAGFIVLTGVGLVQLSQPVPLYDDTAQSVDVLTPTQWTVAIDCYGPQSQNWAVTMSTVFKTAYACDQLVGLAPLYAGDAVQFPLVDGESQYEERWRFDAVFQYNPVVSLPQQSATVLEIGVISVDPTYPPGV